MQAEGSRINHAEPAPWFPLYDDVVVGWRQLCAFASLLAACSTGAKTGGTALSGGGPTSGTDEATGTDAVGTTEMMPSSESSGGVGSTTSGEGGSTTASVDATSGSGSAGGSSGSADVGPVGFDADPGWVSYNLPLGGNDYGWTNTAHAGGEAGEIGGFFQRPSAMSYYADIDIVVASDGVIEAAGRFNVVDVQDGHNYNTFIGHFLVADTDGGRLGIEILEPGDGEARVRLVHGANSFDVFDLQDLNLDRDWSYRYDPSIGTYGSIEVTVEGQGTESYDLDEADRTAIASLDAFGFLTRQNDNAGDYTGLLEMYFDDIDYTR
jgi:hypothetical protein